MRLQTYPLDDEGWFDWDNIRVDHRDKRAVPGITVIRRRRHRTDESLSQHMFGVVVFVHRATAGVLWGDWA